MTKSTNGIKTQWRLLSARLYMYTLFFLIKVPMYGTAKTRTRLGGLDWHQSKGFFYMFLQKNAIQLLNFSPILKYILSLWQHSELHSKMEIIAEKGLSSSSSLIWTQSLKPGYWRMFRPISALDGQADQIIYYANRFKENIHICMSYQYASPYTCIHYLND